MKKRFMKQFAFLLAVVMTLESAFAVDVTATTAENTVVYQSADVEETTENATTEVAEEDSTDETENTSDESTSDKKQETDDTLADEDTKDDTVSANDVEDSDEQTESDAADGADSSDANEENDSNIEGTQNLFQFLYIENEYVKTPDTQHFLMGIGDENTQVEEASLTLKNIYTGEEMTLTAEEISDGMAVFGTAFNNSTERSIYQAVSVGYKVLGEETKLSLDEIGVQAYFGVNEEVTFADEAADIDLAQVEASIVTTDGLEVTTTADQIGNALMTADAQTGGKSLNAEGLSVTDGSKNTASQRASGNVVIVLDPGHDATHAGASGNGLKEEELNLKIATYCKEELETYDGVTVYMTRSTAACPNPGTTSTDDNAKRVQYAKSVGATAYVSIHINSSNSSGSSGATVYYPNSNYNATIGNNGKGLANKIQAKLAALGIKNNGIQIRNSGDGTKYPDGSLADYYGVIRQSKLNGFPGIIIEHAFISNASDAANFLNSDEKLKKLGVADATGIAEYYGLTKGNGTGNVEVSDQNYAKGTFKVKIKNVDAGKTVQFKVYPKTDQTKEVVYNATYKNGEYYATVDIKYHNNLADTYVINAYSVNASGSLKHLGRKEYDFNEPDFGKVKVTAEPTSTSKKKYKVQTAAVKDAARVVIEIYNTAAKKDSLQSFELTKAKDNTWSVTMAVTKLKMRLGGKYKVTAYAYSCFGTKTKIGTASFEVPSPKMGTIKLTEQNDKKGSFVLTVPNVTSESGISSVQVEVWSKSDKSDAKVYTAKRSGENYVVKGNIKYHDYNYGKYYTVVTVKGKNGISTVSKTKTVKIKQPQATVTAKVSKSQATTKITADNVLLSGNVTDVKVVVCSKAGKKKDKVTYMATKKTKAKWAVNIKNSDVGKTGTYYVTVYAKSDRSDTYKEVGKTTYEVSGPTIASAYVSEKQQEKGTFTVTASGVTCKGGISKVEVLVYRLSNKEAGVTYTAKKKGSKYNAKVDIADLGGKKGTYKVIVTAYSKGGIAYSTKVINVKMKDDVNSNLYAIMGNTSVTVSQMMAYYNANATYPDYYANTDAPTLKKFCELYVSECGTEGVKAEVAFIQAMKETNFLRYGGDVSISQFNFAGLGATGGGVAGASFPSVKIGIRAQVQHLKAYASTDGLVNACVDSRFSYVTRGCAPYVEWLGINENPDGKGWATDKGYGTDIVKRINSLKSYN